LFRSTHKHPKNAKNGVLGGTKFRGVPVCIKFICILAIEIFAFDILYSYLCGNIKGYKHELERRIGGDASRVQNL
jgi:hypothetical protein